MPTQAEIDASRRASARRRAASRPTFSFVSPDVQAIRDKRATARTAKLDPFRGITTSLPRPGPTQRQRGVSSTTGGLGTAREQAIFGTADEGLIRDIVNFGGTFGPAFGSNLGPTGVVGAQRLIAEARAASSAGLLGLGGGGGVGGGSGLGAGAEVKEIHEFEWKDVEFNVESGQAPSWWVGGRVPKNVDDASDPRVNFMMTMNSMIPYMSPEDQRNAAAQLYAMDANHWSEYKPDKLEVAIPTVGAGGTLATDTRRFFNSRARSTGAINMLNQLRKVTVGGNRWKISPGYTWLQQVLGAGESFGGGQAVSSATNKEGVRAGNLIGEAGSGQTRTQFLAQLGALDPLLAQSQSPEIGGFGAIAKMLSQPFFSQGALRPTTRGPSGRTFFGRPNQLLF